jgi:hypothetical protein
MYNEDFGVAGRASADAAPAANARLGWAPASTVGLAHYKGEQTRKFAHASG